MAAKRLKPSTNFLNSNFRHVRRSMATEASPATTLAQSYLDAATTSTPTEPLLADTASIPPPNSAPSLAHPTTFVPQPNPFQKTVHLTTHAFPTFEPTSFAAYPSTHLALPLRKDILHRAVIYEGDMARQGTANTKWRSEVHGSNRKIRPQKGTGMARLGNKKSPMLKGGGVAFGPKPRSFATDLNRKVYDLAWRTALSYRYRKGELVLIEDQLELPGSISQASAARYLRDMLAHNRMGNEHGRTLFVSLERRDALFDALEQEDMGREAKAREVLDVDVKSLLELGRIVVEREALEYLLMEHEEDVGRGERFLSWEKVWAQGMHKARADWAQEAKA